jgi:hypothetical protein
MVRDPAWLLRRVRNDIAATSSGRLRLSADRWPAALATDRPLIPNRAVSEWLDRAAQTKC